MAKKIATGVVHDVPADLKKILVADSILLSLWEGLTPLARNEWICWVTFPKTEETRKEHIKRLVNDLKKGKRRPCCWIGCTHRTDKPISPSIQGILKKRK
jgi:uncharacterized protein YdeI (YjbR/CyaY-like superfamily)